MTSPPIAPRRPRACELHGYQFVDDYAWLRDRETPEVGAYLSAENGYADNVLGPTKALQEELYREMLRRIKQTDLTVPYRYVDHWYYSRTEEGKQYSTYCRKYGSLDEAEEVLVDVNELAVGHSFMALGVYSVSPDGKLLAYSTDSTGFRDHTLSVKDIATGAQLMTPVPRVSSFAWAADSHWFFFTIEDDTKRAYRCYRAALSVPPELTYEEADERFRVHVGVTRSQQFVVLESGSHTTTEARFVPSRSPEDSWQVIAERVQDREYEVDHHGEHFLIRTNDAGRNFRVARIPVADPSNGPWEELLPHRDDVMVEGIDCFSGFWVAWERRAGLPNIRITSFATGASHDIAFDEAVYEAYPSTNRQWDTRLLRYGYESLVTPGSVFDYDVVTGLSVLLKQREVLGGYDPGAYVSERITAVARDGTAIPVSIVGRRDRDRTKPGPIHLAGYGAYGLPFPVGFSSNRLSLLDRGVVYAIAHIRGGGELGRRWHDEGRMAAKMNTFTDFIAVAEHLIGTGRTDRDQLIIEGGSAGGLLMGAVLNLRPELFRAAVLRVPFVDVVNTMLDTSLPLTVAEFEEWGNPADPAQFTWLAAYCPYRNLQAREYPTMLVRTSLNDSQVMYWEPAKYVAKLRTLKTDANPLLLTTNMGAGHGGASGRYDRLREVALDFAFMLWVLERIDG
ncbi:MAG: S9 family peptidase [Gemmatimonadota bacterium]